MKAIKVRVRTGDPQVFVGCVGGCLLMIAWLVVGVVNVAAMSRYDLPGWMSALIGIFWLLSFPVCTVLYLKWRSRRHKKAFQILEGQMTEKTQERLRKQSPNP